MDDSNKKNLTYVLVDRNPDENSYDDSKDTTTRQTNDVNHIINSSDVIDQNNSQIIGRTCNVNDSQNNLSKNNVSTDDSSCSRNQAVNVNYCISVSLLSIITYMIVAYSSNVPFAELIDLEIPLIIFLSLAMVFLSSNWSRIYTYLLFIIVIAVMIALSFNYSFLLMMVLFSELVIYSINGIINNKDDYNSV
ncbi:MAG: hypothetical protein IKF79_08545 [Methanosphaera sp.]|nr:hypothetical protein [Methanosphaera sp.]